MLNDEMLEKASLKVYLQKLNEMHHCHFKTQTIRKVKRKLALLQAPMIYKNKFLNSYTISDLKIIIEECYKEMQGWKNDDGSMDEQGYILNDKLEILHDFFNNKVDSCLGKIKTRDD